MDIYFVVPFLPTQLIVQHSIAVEMTNFNTFQTASF
jgi:hypothetical protein